MANKEIATTEKELVKLIGVASMMYAEEKELPIGIAEEHASHISNTLLDHFSGREKIPEELLKLYDAVTREQDKMLASVFALFGRFI